MFYALRGGLESGVYQTIQECVTIWKKYEDVVFQKFSSYDDALLFVSNQPPKFQNTSNIFNTWINISKNSKSIIS